MGTLFRLVEVVVAAVVAVAVVTQMMGLGLGSKPMQQPMAAETTLPSGESTGPQEVDQAVAKDLEFKDRRTEILASIKALEDSGKWQDLQMAAHPWLDMEDAEIEDGFNKARERDLVAQLSQVPSTDVENNLELYATLVSLNPAESRYQQKRDRYSDLMVEKFGELDPRPSMAAHLCRGTLRAHGRFPTHSTFRSRDTNSQAQADGRVDVAMNLVAQVPQSAPEAYQARCTVLPDRSVEVERFRQL